MVVELLRGRPNCRGFMDVIRSRLSHLGRIAGAINPLGYLGLSGDDCGIDIAFISGWPDILDRPQTARDKNGPCESFCGIHLFRTDVSVSLQLGNDFQSFYGK